MEKNYLIFNEEHERIIKNGDGTDFCAMLNGIDACNRFSIYFTGETKLSDCWRNEVDYQHLYGLIDDSLNNVEAESSRYCLDFSMKGGEGYVKRAVKKVIFPPSLFDVGDLLDGGETWQGGIYAKARGLKINDGGFLHLRFEIRKVREGKDKRLTDNPPDRVVTVDIPEGSYGYEHFFADFDLPNEETASVVVYLEGGGYSGEVYFESPHLTSATGYNVLTEFSTSVQSRPFFDWYGCNLSKIETPHFRIYVGGELAVDESQFEAMHRYPSFEFDLPFGSIKNGKNDIRIEYYSDCREPAPFGIRQVRIIEREGGDIAVIGYGENASLGREFPILIRTGRDGVTAELKCDDGKVECTHPLCFEKAGLHAVTVVPKVAENDLAFSLVSGEKECEIVIPHVSKREDDGVITGTGDAVYINFDSPEFFEKYLEWYTEKNVGKLLTLRPIYRWGGTRSLREEVWRGAADLLSDMDYNYSMMTDGRDIPGYDKHPTPEMIDRNGFLGYQLHERDGQFFYWSYRISRPRQNFQILDEFYDICMRLYRESPITMSSVYKPCNVKMADGKYCLRCDEDLGYDSKDISEGIVRQLADIRDHATRHTGPAVNFRSFFKAGYKWAGAETMYSSTEGQLAFLRGASRAYGADSFGVHAAVQWSSRPHMNDIRYRLYRLALYVPYVCGATEINTEEGLWRIESGFAAYDRYSEACERHMAQQKDFNRYVTSHTRRGRHRSPIALIYGRDDNWTGYHTSTRVVCGCAGLMSGDLSSSWDLLKVFFPECSMRGVAPYSLRIEDKVHMYSGTPYGNVDVVPIETDYLSDHSLVCMAGFNRAEKGDMARLAEFAEKGGTLVLGWPHVSDTSDFRDALDYRHTFSDNAILRIVGGKPEFMSDSYKGNRVRVSTALTDSGTVLERTDSGLPLVVSIPYGSGKIIFVNALEYPGNEAVSGLYAEVVKAQSEVAVANEAVWAECDGGVEFSVYDDGAYGAGGTKYIYLLAVDAHNDPDAPRHVSLRVDKHKYSLDIKFGELIKVAVKNGVAVWADGENAEIDRLYEGSVSVVGRDRVRLSVARDGCVKVDELDFSKRAEITVEI